ncbi:hypothetical protein EK21DRAFT_119457 [Setomelanomma holmii]|uniref:Uncharacterized protein n=1 Tax=Setomelanomma holmii TaxID=210430 RepID=A0A9P4GU15_9PLEO|nr:hypothetical protein EK21DRAFT_119457 [Setomelanomma holmii]
MPVKPKTLAVLGISDDERKTVIRELIVQCGGLGMKDLEYLERNRKETDGKDRIFDIIFNIPQWKPFFYTPKHKWIITGTSFTPDGTSLTPDGTSLTPDGTSLTPDGTSFTPDGLLLIITPDQRDRLLEISDQLIRMATHFAENKAVILVYEMDNGDLSQAAYTQSVQATKDSLKRLELYAEGVPFVPAEGRSINNLIEPYSKFDWHFSSAVEYDKGTVVAALDKIFEDKSTWLAWLVPLSGWSASLSAWFSTDSAPSY